VFKAFGTGVMVDSEKQAIILTQEENNNCGHPPIRLLESIGFGAGRFERPTPCAQGSFRPNAKNAYFQSLIFQAFAGDLLRVVDFN
jgi:hypothetical protein